METKNPAGKPAGLGKRVSGLALAELEPFARAGLAVFLAFLHARIAGEKTHLLELLSECLVLFEKGLSYAVTQSTCLSRNAAALYCCLDIVSSLRISSLQGLNDTDAVERALEILINGPLVDRDLAFPRKKTHTCNSFLPFASGLCPDRRASQR